MLKVLARIVLFSVIVSSTGGMAWWWYQFRQQKTRTHTVDVGDLLSGVTVSGTIRNKQKTVVAAEIVAAVQRLAVAEGQLVEPGTVLVELDDRIVAAECAKSQSRIELAKQYLAELKAGPRKEEITKARQAVVQAESELSYAKSSHEKTDDLVRRGAATKSELDLEEKKLKVAQAAMKSAQAELELLEAGTRIEQVARAEADVRLAEAELQRCQALREKYVLRAPHRGIVTAKHVEMGEVVSPGQVLLHLNNVDSTEIRAQVQETQLSGIKPGHMARVLADAYPDQPLEAVVERILPRVDPESGTVTVLLKLDKPTALTLMDGMAVDIALIRQQRRDVIRVPAEAVKSDGERAEVWLRKGDSFVRRDIQVGVNDGQWVEVRSGLAPGDVVRVH